MYPTCRIKYSILSMNNPHNIRLDSLKKYILLQSRAGNFYILERKKTRWHEVERIVQPGKSGFHTLLVINKKLGKNNDINERSTWKLNLISTSNNIEDVKTEMVLTQL